MTPRLYYRDSTLTLYTGDAIEVLTTLPDASVHCVITSPPYWELRDYGTTIWIGGNSSCVHSVHTGAGHNFPDRCSRCGAVPEDHQYGLEPIPEDYINTLRAVFAQLRRILVDAGTVWLKLGDSYSALPSTRMTNKMCTRTLPEVAHARTSATFTGDIRNVPRKNLWGIPWKVAFALQADGWILRNAIVWHKPNAMPEPVRDRLSTRYEMLFLFTKQQRYWFDLDAIREPLSPPESLSKGIMTRESRQDRHTSVGPTAQRCKQNTLGKYSTTEAFLGRKPGTVIRPTGYRHNTVHPNGRNPGDVWSIPTRPLREAHFAAFPIDIPLRCIAAGCPPSGTVLDPFSGAATTALAARRLNRSSIGIDLNPEFHAIGLRRLGLNTPTTDQSRKAA